MGRKKMLEWNDAEGVCRVTALTPKRAGGDAGNCVACTRRCGAGTVRRSGEFHCVKLTDCRQIDRNKIMFGGM